MKILVSDPRRDCCKTMLSTASHAISEHWQLLSKYITPSTFAWHLVRALAMFYPFPVFRSISGRPQMSAVYSFPIPFCGLPFAAHVSSITFTAYHPLLTASLPGLELEGEFSSQRSDWPGPSLLCSQQHEVFLYNVLGVTGSWDRGSLLDPLMPSSCGKEITVSFWQEDRDFLQCFG